jgi:hypothetical protein
MKIYGLNETDDLIQEHPGRRTLRLGWNRSSSQGNERSEIRSAIGQINPRMAKLTHALQPSRCATALQLDYARNKAPRVEAARSKPHTQCVASSDECYSVDGISVSEI